MSNIVLMERVATAEEFIDLRKAVGWGHSAPETVEKGLAGSLYSVCVLDGAKFIGHGRIIGDGAFALYIQDIIVRPEYQRQGVGMMIMTAIMQYIKENYGKGTMVGLMAARGKEDFYKKFGFFTRPNENFGCGMTQFLP